MILKMAQLCHSVDMSQCKPMDIFESKKLVTVSAPMVRYSKLAFRTLVRRYNCDLCFTPMIISDSFIKSHEARSSDFTTSYGDAPLIVQFAANNSHDFAAASELVFPYCSGVDLNCGCPQRWAINKGYGACLIHKPELVSDLVKETRRIISDSEFTVSAKIRLHRDHRKTVEYARHLEAAGLSFLTVHGRTVEQTSELNLEAISDIKASVSIPVISNGNIRSLQEAIDVQQKTHVDGVMAARGILNNPAMYAGYTRTPMECIENWVRIALELGTPFTCLHHHLIYMMEHSLCRAERKYFNVLSSTTGVLSFLMDKYKLFS